MAKPAMTALLLALALALPARAQEAALPDPGFSDLIEALEVVAPPPGPAIWRAKKGDSELIVLGGLSPLPHALVWDTGRVERALDGARELLLPPRARVSLLGAPGALLAMTRLRSDTAPEEKLPPEVAARFARIRDQAVRAPADRYARYKPAVAAAMLLADYREAAGLSTGKPGTTVERLAEARHVPSRPMSTVSLGGLMGPLGKMTPEQNAVCVSEILNEIERENLQAQSQAASWAKGDIAAFKASRPTLPMEGCLAVIGGYRKVLEQATAEATQAMQAALAKPGRTVAVLDLVLLLRSNGVLDRLKASGAEISSPP
jgi:uncharacterized protein YbaP (TraB family)